jgi:FkbM family methyltransferase
MNARSNLALSRIIGLLHLQSRKRSARAVKAILGDQQFVLLDIGASGGHQARWKYFKSSIKYWLVEPDQRSVEILMSDSSMALESKTRVITKVLWNEVGSVTLNLCNDPRQTSVFQPNMDLLSRYPFINNYQVESQVTLECSTLDQIFGPSDSNIDFIKLDVQGSELPILSAGLKTLEKVLALEVEVEFRQMYKDQPLFSDVFDFLTGHGFEFLDFVHINRWERSAFTGLGQATFADAVFIRNPEEVVGNVTSGKWTLSMARKYMAILFIYKRFDLVLYCVSLLSDLKLIDERTAQRITRTVARPYAKLRRLQSFALLLNRLLNENANLEPTSPSIHFQL